MTIEWIEYEKLKNIKQVTEGGCSIIYTAEWTEGYLSYWDIESQNWKEA